MNQTPSQCAHGFSRWPSAAVEDLGPRREPPADGQLLVADETDGDERDGEDQDAAADGSERRRAPAGRSSPNRQRGLPRLAAGASSGAAALSAGVSAVARPRRRVLSAGGARGWRRAGRWRARAAAWGRASTRGAKDDVAAADVLHVDVVLGGPRAAGDSASATARAAARAAPTSACARNGEGDGQHAARRAHRVVVHHAAGERLVGDDDAVVVGRADERVRERDPLDRAVDVVDADVVVEAHGLREGDHDAADEVGERRASGDADDGGEDRGRGQHRLGHR